MTAPLHDLENILNGTLLLFKPRYTAEIALVQTTIELLKSDDDITAEDCEQMRQKAAQLEKIPIPSSVTQQQHTALVGTRKRVKELVLRAIKQLTNSAIESSASKMAAGSGEGGDTEEYYLEGATKQFNQVQQVNIAVNQQITRAEADVKRWLDGKLGKSVIDKHLKDLSYETSKMNDKMRKRYDEMRATVARPPVKSASRDDDWLNDEPATVTASAKKPVTATVNTSNDDDDDWY